MRELPPMLQGDALRQIAQLRDYLVRQERNREQGVRELVREERLQRSAAPSGGESPGPAPADEAEAVRQARKSAAGLRALIVKTAEQSGQVIRESVGELSRELHQNYLATSEFGSYQQEISTLIEATAAQIAEIFHCQELVEGTLARLGEQGERFARYQTEISGQIRRGFLEDPDTHETVLGIAIAQNLRFTGQELSDAGEVYYELDSGQTLGLYTSSGWQFWVNGRKVGWFDSADGMLHTVRQAVESELRLGDWSLSPYGGLGIRRAP